jgi:surfeit locus 1 family protein
MRLRIPLLLVTLPALGILLWLGQWQLQRLEWKSGIIEAMEVRRSLPPFPLGEVRRLESSGDDIEFLPVRLDGEFLPDLQLRFDTSAVSEYNRRDVYMPMVNDAGLIWVHVGVAGPDQRVFAPPNNAVGFVRKSRRPNRFVPDNDPAASVWHWPDLPALTRQVEARSAELLPPMALHGHYVALQPAFDSQQDRFTLENSRAQPVFSNNHLGYALTWFGMAVGLVVIVALMHRQPRRRMD